MADKADEGTNKTSEDTERMLNIFIEEELHSKESLQETEKRWKKWYRVMEVALLSDP